MQVFFNERHIVSSSGKFSLQIIPVLVIEAKCLM